MGWNYFSIPKLQRLHRWSLGMDKWFHPTHYDGCNYLSMLGLKLVKAAPDAGTSVRKPNRYSNESSAEYPTLNYQSCHNISPSAGCGWSLSLVQQIVIPGNNERWKWRGRRTDGWTDGLTEEWMGGWPWFSKMMWKYMPCIVIYRLQIPDKLTEFMWLRKKL